MTSVLPATIEVQHQSWTTDGSTNNRGNPTGALSDPVTRYVVGFYRLKWADPHPDPISVDFLSRTIADLVMLTHEPNVYKKLDRVLLNDGDEWLAYEVLNQPISWSNGFSWKRYSSLLAGEVHVRRVE